MNEFYATIQCGKPLCPDRGKQQDAGIEAHPKGLPYFYLVCPTCGDRWTERTDAPEWAKHSNPMDIYAGVKGRLLG